MIDFLIKSNNSNANYLSDYKSIRLTDKYILYSKKTDFVKEQNDRKLIIIGDCINKEVIIHLEEIDINFIINVKKKAKTLESQVNKYMSGSVQLKPAEADEEGKVVKEAVCYKPSTEEDLVKQLNSSLDVPVVVKDIIKCSSFTKEINWEEYKASFIGE